MLIRVSDLGPGKIAVGLAPRNFMRELAGYGVKATGIGLRITIATHDDVRVPGVFL